MYNKYEVVQMGLYEYLLENYGTDEPIFLDSLDYENHSETGIRQGMKRLCDENKIKRFENGIYYIPTYNELGESVLSSKKVAYLKYIKSKEDYIGYYADVTLLNLEGFSNQVPNMTYIVTNKEKTNRRTIEFGNTKFVLLKPKTRITNDNVKVLTFLSLLDVLGTRYDQFEFNLKVALQEYVIKNNINRNDLLEYATYYSNKTCKLLIESGVLHDKEKVA